MSTPGTRKDFIELGYRAGIVLAYASLLFSALFLFVFVFKSTDFVRIEDPLDLIGLTATRRLHLLATAIFVAMSFGFLGFALFLIQAKGDADVDVSVKDYKLKATRLAPGLFVILCATVIIIWCATYPIEYEASGKRVPRTGSIRDYEDAPGDTSRSAIR